MLPQNVSLWYIDYFELQRHRDGASQMALVVKNSTANARDTRDTGLIPRLGISPGGGQGNTLQYSCLKNPMNRGTWRATQSQIQLKRFTTLADTWTPGYSICRERLSLNCPYLSAQRQIFQKELNCHKSSSGEFHQPGKTDSSHEKGDQKWTSHPVRFCHKLY